MREFAMNQLDVNCLSSDFISFVWSIMCNANDMISRCID